MEGRRPALEEVKETCASHSMTLQITSASIHRGPKTDDHFCFFARVHRGWDPGALLPPWTPQAYAAATLLQSAYRGHLQRVAMLVKRRLLPSTELPLHIASLAHKMIR